MPAEPELPALFEADGYRLTGSGSEFKCLCPNHDEKTPSCTLFHKGDKWRFHCFGCGWRGDTADYLEQRHGLSKRDALRSAGAVAAPAVKERGPFIEKLPQADVRYLYRNAEGRCVFVVLRHERAGEKKWFTPYTREGKGWRKGLEWGHDRPLYRLTELRAGDQARQVVVVEGEKCADAVAAYSKKTVVVSWVSGSSSWRRTDWAPLHGRKLLLVADGDEPGHKCMRAIAQAMSTHCPDITLVLPPAAANGEKAIDIADIIETDPKGVAKWIQDHATPYTAEPEPGPESPAPAPPLTIPREGEHFRMVGKANGRVTFELAEGVTIHADSAYVDRIRGRLAPRHWWATQGEK